MGTEERAKLWLGKLTRLNPNQARPGAVCRGKAPHKPLLLLCLLDMAETGELTSRTIARSAGMVLRFRSYGTIVADRWPTRLDLRMPFYYLSSQKFWEPFTSDMRRATSPETCVVCDLHPEFFELLGDASFRMKARIVLTSQYFESAERIALLESLGLHNSYETGPSTGLVLKEAAEAAKRKGRCARFAVRVVSEYLLVGQSCRFALRSRRRSNAALPRYKGASIVDAAHIEPWAETQNDDVTNGLALSKSAHWMFDEGLWSVDENLRIVVNTKQFKEHGSELVRLNSFAGRHLQFDPAAKLRPAPGHLKKHRAANVSCYTQYIL